MELAEGQLKARGTAGELCIDSADQVTPYCETGVSKINTMTRAIIGSVDGGKSKAKSRRNPDPRDYGRLKSRLWGLAWVVKT